MIDTKLILLDGIPGSGNSTTTQYLPKLLKKKEVKKMVNDVKALLWYLTNNPKLLEDNCKILFIRPFPDDDLLNYLRFCVVDYYQPFRPYADILEEKGLQLSLNISNHYDRIIYLATKYKEENLYNLALSCTHLQSDGCLLIIQTNDKGSRSLEKKVTELFSNVQVFTKSKCRIYLCFKKGYNQEVCDDWLKLGDLKKIPDSDLFSNIGIFSSKKIDLGSQLLLKTILNENLFGKGADLGSGYGYLSYYILEKFNNIEEMHLYEAENKAIEASKFNLERLSSQTRISYHWADISKGLIDKNMDWIVMNPPFHEGSNENVSIGRMFIENAAKGLKKRGTLYLVANRHLPYEEIIGKLFNTINVIQEQGFKVYILEKK